MQNKQQNKLDESNKNQNLHIEKTNKSKHWQMLEFNGRCVMFSTCVLLVKNNFSFQQQHWASITISQRLILQYVPHEKGGKRQKRKGALSYPANPAEDNGSTWVQRQF